MLKRFHQGPRPGKSTNSTTSHHNKGLLEARSRTTGKQRDLILTNILEEGSSVDEPRSFEKDEQYLNECLQVLNEPSEELVEEGDLEEYDFDDYNSVASTASLLNIHAELTKEDAELTKKENSNTRGSAKVHLPSTQNTQSKAFPQRSVANGEAIIYNGSGSNNYSKQLPKKWGQKSSRVQASISKVTNWKKLGSSLTSEDEWKEVFLKAAETGDLTKIQETYYSMGGTNDIVIRVTDSNANTALHKAALVGDLHCLQWLIEQLPANCISNITNHNNLSPLAIAVKHGHVKCVEWLLEKTSAAAEVQNDASRLELMFLVVQHGQDECLQYLLSFMKRKYIELDVSVYCGVTLAHVAAKEGHMTCLQTLVDYNIDVISEDRDGRTPADWAYAAGQTSCARYLVMVESCWLLSVRVAKLHGELKECKAENAELKKNMGEYSPDGESPKGLGYDRKTITSQHYVNGTSSPEKRALLKSNGTAVVNTDGEVRSAHHFEALKQRGRLGHRGSFDSVGSGGSTPLSWSDMAADSQGEMHQDMAKQIADVTRRLIMSKHAQKVEEAPLLRANPVLVRKESPARSRQRGQDSSPPFLQTESYYSSSSSRSHSPSRTDSTSSSHPGSEKAREAVLSVKDEQRETTPPKRVFPSRISAVANRRETSSSFSSDSTHSSDSDVDRSGRRTSATRHRRFYSPSTRTQEHTVHDTDSRQRLHGLVSGEMRTAKIVSWNVSPKGGKQTTVNNQSSSQRPPAFRLPLERPDQVTSSNTSDDPVDRSVGKMPVPSVVVHPVVTPALRKSVRSDDIRSYSFAENQLDEKPWYETEEFY